mmetsp:Transcript_16997/g.27538  ORF Transcript_16997/g.27538 Transcript_16997/m.27538 type:complete len:203 (+) Transcript_16997:258-866(+)
MSNYRPSRVKSCLKKCKTIRRPETKAGLTSDPCNTISRNRHKFHIDSPLVFCKQYHGSSTHHSSNANLLCKFNRIRQHDCLRVYICRRYTPDNTTRSLQKPGNILVIGNANNCSHWPVFRNETCCHTTPCCYKDGGSSRVQGTLHSSSRHVFSCAYSAEVTTDTLANVQIPGVVIEGGLCFFNNPAHDCYSFKRKLAACSLS